MILGATVRAAAQSAVRAAFAPICGDLFGDADLRAAHRCEIARRYPSDLAIIAQKLPAMSWMYTGGLENYPSLVAQISQRHQLYGNPPDTLRRVRDPFVVSEVLANLSIDCPECRRADDPPPRDGGWLLKHRRSSGGHQVTLWESSATPPPGGGRSPWYFQRRIGGIPCGAVFVAAGGNARLVGVTEQLITGETATPFRYAGSIGPRPLAAPQRASIARLGHALATAFGLRGLFGVDLVIDGDAVWPVEVNPRYAASIEVLERATGVKSVALHTQACAGDSLSGWHPPNKTSWCGKLVVYASRSSVISAEQSAGLLTQNDGRQWPNVADVPTPGTRVRRGQPLLTVFAEAGDRESLLEMLADHRRNVERNLFRSHTGS